MMAVAVEGPPETRDSGGCAGGDSEAMDFGDLGCILSFFFFFFSHVCSDARCGGQRAFDLTVGSKRSGRTGCDRPKFSASAPDHIITGLDNMIWQT